MNASESGFTKVEKQNIADEILNQILEKIARGEWKPGDKLLPEAKLREAFGISRHVLRNVLSKLNILGIIDTRQGDGSYIKLIDPSVYLNSTLTAALLSTRNFHTVSQFRMGIETEAVRLAALNASPEQLDDLKKILVELRSSRDDLERYSRIDMDFHIKIAEISGNSMFMQAMNIIKIFYLNSIDLMTDIDEYSAHEDIYFAIETHDPIKAEYCMRLHIQAVLKNVQRFSTLE